MINRLKELHKARLDAKDNAQLEKINDELQYLYAKKNDEITSYREKAIAARVAKKYSLDKQIEILLNGDVGEIALLKAYRVQMATEVDQLIKQYESDLNSN